MTDAKESIVTPEWIAGVRHNWGLDTMSPHDAATKWSDTGLPFSGIVAALGHALDHIATLTRERDEVHAARDAALELAKSECDSNDSLRTQLAAAREALRDIAENYDHEEQTRHHNPKYGGHCRVCVATAALSEAP